MSLLSAPLAVIIVSLSVAVYCSRNLGRSVPHDPFLKKLKGEFYKLVLLGSPGSGKTSLVKMLTKIPIDPNEPATLGLSVDKLALTSKDGASNFDIYIWDAPGQEACQPIVRPQLRNAHIILLVYDAADEGSFEHLKRLKALQEPYMNPSSRVIVVGNRKVAHGLDSKLIAPIRAKTYAAESNYHGHVEVSLDSEESINQLERMIADACRNLAPANSRKLAAASAPKTPKKDCYLSTGKLLIN